MFFLLKRKENKKTYLKIYRHGFYNLIKLGVKDNIAESKSSINININGDLSFLDVDEVFIDDECVLFCYTLSNGIEKKFTLKPGQCENLDNFDVVLEKINEYSGRCRLGLRASPNVNFYRADIKKRK